MKNICDRHSVFSREISIRNLEILRYVGSKILRFPTEQGDLRGLHYEEGYAMYTSCLTKAEIFPPSPYHRHRKLFGLRGGGYIFKYDFLFLLVDTNEEQCLKLLQYCNGVHYVGEVGGGRRCPPNLKLTPLPPCFLRLYILYANCPSFWHSVPLSLKNA